LQYTYYKAHNLRFDNNWLVGLLSSAIRRE
jgi:hypothetical protein